MECYEAEESHPYGVLPEGNMYFASRSELMTRYFGLGPLLSTLTDELVGEVLGFLGGQDLMRTLLVSRTLYCHAHCSDLWRDVTLREFEGKGIKYRGNWRDAYMFTYAHHAKRPVQVQEHKPIRMKGVFSAYLHRSWSCHTCDLATACPGFYDFSDIPVRLARELSVEQFIEQYESPNKPVVIRGAMETAPFEPMEGDTRSYCPALERWTNDYLAEQCGPKNRLRATSAAAPLPAHFTATEYFAYAAQAHEEAPLYLFERNFASMAPGLLKDYEVSKYFRASSSQAHTTDTTSPSSQSPDRVPLNPAKLSNPNLIYETDLFRVLGETGRPDYRWLVAGPARSGSLFHIDPNQTNAWNLCIRGRKKWIFYPPGVSPPGVECSADGADVVVPISTGEWLLTFWKYHLEARQDPDPRRRPLEVILNPGEVIFVPHGYWHMVVNLEESIALTHNYVSTSNLADCLRFLREKVDQISGVRDRGGEAIAPECMYAEFVDKLRSVLPVDEVQRYVAESLQPASGALSECVKAKLLRQRAAKTIKRKSIFSSGTAGAGGGNSGGECVSVQAAVVSPSASPDRSSVAADSTSSSLLGGGASEKSSFTFGFAL